MAYRAREYWTERLGGEFSLRGTGHVGYSRAYNTWVYRDKQRALERAVRDLEPPVAVLDAGCGTGWGIAQLLRLGIDEIEGCDVVPEVVRRLSQRFPEATFFEVELGTDEIPRPDGTYDLAIAFDVLYHIVSDEQWEVAVADLARVLRPGGRLAITDDLLHPDSDPAEHVRLRSLDLWKAAADRLGLEIRSVYPVHGWVARPKRSGPLWLVPGAIRGPLEHALDRVAPREPHLHCALMARVGD